MKKSSDFNLKILEEATNGLKEENLLNKDFIFITFEGYTFQQNSEEIMTIKKKIFKDEICLKILKKH